MPSISRLWYALKRKVVDLQFTFVISTAVFLSILLAVFFYIKVYEVSYIVFLVVSILIPFILYYVVDKYLFHDFDTLIELRRGNYAVALYLLAYAIIAAAAILAASGALGTIFGGP